MSECKNCDQLKAQRDEALKESDRQTEIADLMTDYMPDAKREAEKDRQLAIAREALENISQNIPAMEGGSFYREHFDLNGNYIGSENIDPISVVQMMQEMSQRALTELDKKKGTE